MVIQVERGQKLYIADEADHVFEGALLEVDLSKGVARLDPLAQLTLDATTRTWRLTPLPKGPARTARLTVVHDDENEARHYSLKHYTSPLGEPGTWEHPSKRVWRLTVGGAAAPVIAVDPSAARGTEGQAAPSIPVAVPEEPAGAAPALG